MLKRIKSQFTLELEDVGNVPATSRRLPRVSYWLWYWNVKLVETLTLKC